MMSRDTNALSRRSFLRLSAAATGGVILFGTSACGGEKQGGGSGYSGDVAITGLASLIHSAPFFIAEAEGYYEAQKLKLKHVQFPGGLDTVRGIASGVGFGSPATLPVFIAAEKGLPVKVVANVYSAASVDFIAPAGSSISKIEDVAGKKLAVSTPGSNSTYFAERTLRQAGLEPGSDVELVNVGTASDSWTAAKQGVVDVAWTASPLSDKLVVGDEAKVIWRSRDYVQEWSDTCICATDDFIEDNGEALKGWIQAVQRGMDMIRANPQQAADIYGKAIKFAPEVALAALQGSGDVYRTRITMAEIEAVVEAGLAQKQLKQEPNLDKLVLKDFTA